MTDGRRRRTYLAVAVALAVLGLLFLWSFGPARRGHGPIRRDPQAVPLP